MSAPCKILIFDDMAKHLTEAGFALQKQGYDVRLCFNGDEAAFARGFQKIMHEGDNMDMFRQFRANGKLICDNNTANASETGSARSEAFLVSTLQKEMEVSGSDFVVLSDFGVSTARSGYYTGTEFAVAARKIGFTGAFLIHTSGHMHKDLETGEPCYDYDFKKVSIETPDHGNVLKAEIEAGIKAAQARQSGTTTETRQGGGTWTGLAQRFDDGIGFRR